MRLGRGSLTAKIDVHNAYRIVPVHTEYRRVAGYEMAGCLLCRYGPTFRCQVSFIYVHIYSRFSGVSGQATL